MLNFNLLEIKDGVEVLRGNWLGINADTHDQMVEAAAVSLAKNAKNGNELVFTRNGDTFYPLGLFQGKGNSRKQFIRYNPSTAYRRDMVYCALDKDGDRQWVETLRILACKEMQKDMGITISTELFEILVKDQFFPYQAVVADRLQWRKDNGLTTDCRRYDDGQTDRDMRRMPRRRAA